MRPPNYLRFLALAALTLGLALPRGSALLNIDGSRNQVFVFGNVNFGYSSNIFAEAAGRGDYSSTAGVGIELKRHAGIIAINATFKVDFQRYSSFTSQNSSNPSFAIELNKTTGRTTGAFTVSAFRQTRSDAAVNLRTTSWNFPLGLNLKYPVSDKFYLTSGTTFLQQSYVDTNLLTNLTDYSESLDVFYVYNSKIDLIGGYRIRESKTSNGNGSSDHWFNFGVTGGLFAKLNGTLRVGYQVRQDHATHESYGELNALAALGWPVTRKFSLSSQLSRDFSTVATGATVDSINATLQAAYTFNRKLEGSTGIGVGRTVFLGSTQSPRTDRYFSWDVGASYKLNEHLKLGASYTLFRNGSTASVSNFTRQGLSFDFSSRF